MNEYIASMDELMDLACHFLIEGEKGREYSDEELVEAIRRARFERLTRCKDCRFSRDHAIYCVCKLDAQRKMNYPNHYCLLGEPRRAGQ